jgi:hypothetical protein
MSTGGRTGRRRAVWTVVLSLVIGVSGPLPASAATHPSDSPVAAQPAPPPLPPPTDPPPSTTPPCTGEDCTPQSTTAPLPATGTTVGQPGEGGSERADCGITSIGGCVTNAITSFFRDLVIAALNPLLDLLSTSLLTTPSPESLPRVGELWTQSWQILLACYGLLVMTAGLVLMAYESLQTHYSIKEIAPRLVVGFLTGALSLFLATKAIELANALATAMMGGGLDTHSAGTALKSMLTTALTGGIFLVFLGVFLVVALIVLLITYLVRVALTIILIAGAPVALMCHGLPQTEPVAYWWWKAFSGCLAIQLVQSLALITGLRVFGTPGGFTPFGSTSSGLVNLLVALALLYILIKIPFWILGSLRIGGARRSLVGTVARAYVIGRTLQLFRH